MSTSKHNGAPAANGTNQDQRSGRRQAAFELQIGVATRHRLFVGLTSNISSGGPLRRDR